MSRSVSSTTPTASSRSSAAVAEAKPNFAPPAGWLSRVPRERDTWHTIFLNDYTIQETKVLRLPVWQDGKAIFADSNRTTPLWQKVKAASGDAPPLWGSWFHGTTIAGVANILKTGIQPSGMANTDFSDTAAFYMGDNLLMATRWALSKALATDLDDAAHTIQAAILVFGNIEDSNAFPDQESFFETVKHGGYVSQKFTSHLDPNWIEWTKVCRAKKSNKTLARTIQQTSVIKGPVVGNLSTWEHIPSMLQIAVRDAELTECLAHNHLTGIILLERQDSDTVSSVSEPIALPVPTPAPRPVLSEISPSPLPAGLWARVAASKPLCKVSK